MRGKILLILTLGFVRFYLQFVGESHAIGGCGSTCLPFDAVQSERKTTNKGQLRIALNNELTDFNDWRIKGDNVKNAVGASALINYMTLLMDLGVSDRITASLMLPYVHKIQETKMYRKRQAIGIGDVSLLGSYEILKPKSLSEPSVAGTIGMKFPTGAINRPKGRKDLLQQPFQTGSGAFDLLLGASYYWDFTHWGLYGGFLGKISLEENYRHYKYGNELRVQVGAKHPFTLGRIRMEALLELNGFFAGKDKDKKGLNSPPFLRDGDKVLDTGGNFLNISPGFKVFLRRNVSLDAFVSLPVFEDWNGKKNVTIPAGTSINLGQVGSDVLFQFRLGYQFRLF